MGKSLLGHWESKITYTMEEAKARAKVELKPLSGFTETDITNRCGILIMGHAGIGKTSILRQAAAEMNAEFWTTQVGGNVVEDNHGLQTVVDGQSKHAVAAHMEALFREPRAATRVGLALWDEVASGDKMHQNDVRYMIDGALDENVLHHGWRKFACTNPPLPEYSTVSDMDQALLERFKVLVVDPTAEEKVQYWSRAMQPTLYKFLLLNHLNKEHQDRRDIVQAITPRIWSILADGVERILRSGSGTSLAIKEVTSETGITIGELFREYLAHGDNPEKYPISGKALAMAEGQERKDLQARWGRWMSRNEDALVGATKWDLAEWLSNKDNEKIYGASVKVKELVASNIALFCVDLGESKKSDMAYSIITALRKTSLVSVVMGHIKGTKLEKCFIRLYEETQQAETQKTNIKQAATAAA